MFIDVPGLWCWQVTGDRWQVLCDIFFFFSSSSLFCLMVWVSVLLTAKVLRFSVSRMRNLWKSKLPNVIYAHFYFVEIFIVLKMIQSAIRNCLKYPRQLFPCIVTIKVCCFVSIYLQIFFIMDVKSDKNCQHYSICCPKVLTPKDRLVSQPNLLIFPKKATRQEHSSIKKDYLL